MEVDAVESSGEPHRTIDAPRGGHPGVGDVALREARLARVAGETAVGDGRRASNRGCCEGYGCREGGGDRDRD